MRFNSIKELEEHIFLCDIKIKDLEYELNNYLDELKKLGLFNPLKKEIKEKIKSIKKSLNEVIVDKDDTIKIFSKCSTFKYNIFLDFLAKYISLVEKEEYIVKTVFERFYRGGRFDPYTDTYYKIITTPVNANKLENSKSKRLGKVDTEDIREYLRACTDDKYLPLYSKETYTLLDGTKLDNSFAKYPYLKELGYEIVDLTLKNPMLTDRDILDAMLEKPYVKKLNK